MWSASGNRGEKWIYANVAVGDNSQYRVVFEATSGSPGTTDFAIDDVSFTPECATGRKFLLFFIKTHFSDAKHGFLW